MKKIIQVHPEGICRRGRAPPFPLPPLQNPQKRRFGLATATVGAPRTRLVRRAEAGPNMLSLPRDTSVTVRKGMWSVLEPENP